MKESSYKIIDIIGYFRYMVNKQTFAQPKETVTILCKYNMVFTLLMLKCRKHYHIENDTTVSNMINTYLKNDKAVLYITKTLFLSFLYLNY